MSHPSQPFPLSPPHLQALSLPPFSFLFFLFFYFIDILLRQPRSLPTLRIDGLCLQGKVPKISAARVHGASSINLVTQF